MKDEVQMVHCLNMNTNCEFFLYEEDYKANQKDMKFINYVNECDVVERKAKKKPADLDIHQFNKTKLIEVAKEMGVKVSTAMTVGKIKEAILDHKALVADDDIEEI